MNTFKKFAGIVVVGLGVSIISLCLTGCMSTHEHPSSEHPEAEHAAEHPKAEDTAEHPKAEDATEHPKAEDPK